MTPFARTLIALTALASAPLAAMGANATATATLSDSSAEVGQSVEYRIDVENARPENDPKAPEVEGLTVTSAQKSFSNHFTVGNGISSVSVTTYTFTIEASHAGRFVIPSQAINIGSGTLRVEPVTLTITSGGSGGASANDAAKAYFAQLKLDKTSAYIGEIFPAEARACFGAQLRFDPAQGASLTGDGFTTQKFLPPTQDVQSVDGARYNIITYRTALTGVKTGTLSVGLADMPAIVQVPQTGSRRRSNFSNPFDDDPFFANAFGGASVAQPKRVTLRTAPQSLEIKPLPPGAPADFSGAVGHFTLEAEVDPRKAQTGDPVTVHLHLTGDGNFDRVTAPTISDEKGLHLYPPSAKFHADDKLGLQGTKTFEQVIVSQNARKSLPSYHFSYLDPDTGKYVSLKTEPLTISIEGAAAPAETPAPVIAAPSAATPSATPAPAPKPRDILYIRTDAGPAASFAPIYRRPVFWWVQAIVAVGLALLGGIGRRRNRSRNDLARKEAEAQRRQLELLKTLKTEGTARRDFYSAAARLAQLKAGMTAGRPGEHLTLAEVCAAQRFDSQKAASVEQIFHRHDELAYSGGAVAQEPVPLEERRTVLETLETFGK